MCIFSRTSLTDSSQIQVTITKHPGMEVVRTMPNMLIVDDDLHLRKLVLTYAQMGNFQCREVEYDT